MIVLVGIRNHVLNFHKKVQGLLPVRFFNQGRHVMTFSPLFYLLYSPPFFPSKNFELSKHISLHPLALLLHANRAQLLAQHILSESPPFLNSLHSFKLTYTYIHTRVRYRLIEENDSRSQNP